MKKILILAALFLIVIVIGTNVYAKFKQKQDVKGVAQAPLSASDDLSSANQNPINEPTIAPSKTYPMDRFNERISLNPFGNHLDGKDSPRNVTTDIICPTRKGYVGYHTGSDLEIFDDELNSAVPVKSIADGTVRQIGFVNGYGGLIVIEHEINGQIYTAYYGHVDISSSSLKKGDLVKTGEQIAMLAPQCSEKNGFTRKHLHFGLHLGKNIDVKGYVSTKNDLNNWVNSEKILN